MKRLITLLSVIAVKAAAQCVMCFRTAAAQQVGRARILNVGILLLGIPPFLILAAFLYLAWRRSQSYAEGGGAQVPVATEQAQRTGRTRITLRRPSLEELYASNLLPPGKEMSRMTRFFSHRHAARTSAPMNRSGEFR